MNFSSLYELARKNAIDGQVELAVEREVKVTNNFETLQINI
jgi:hypothetical protein